MKTDLDTIDTLLKPWQRFGVHLGLERIERLLAKLGNPHHKVPIIHVAGTNGKGSVCAYLSAVLTEAGYRVGRYTSPHLIDWTERICINEKPIYSEDLVRLLKLIQAVINSSEETPTQFEVITAAAWLYFAQSQVDIAVIEVGLGGRLDATNICQNPLLTIITSISREHWQVLGPTLADIAREKAGILKPRCPAVIGELPPEAQAVVTSRIEALNCPAIWVKSAQKIGEGWAKYQSQEGVLRNRKSLEYPLPLLGDSQLMNSALAIASLQLLQQQGWHLSDGIIQTGMGKTRWRGRLQWLNWQNCPILIDGAHNPAAAQTLRHYVDTLAKPITWVMGILAPKEHRGIFQALLRSQDQLYLVPVPDHSSADPQALASLAREICPDLANLHTFSDLFLALDRAIQNHHNSERVVVLCGSLYLVGYFLKHSSEIEITNSKIV